MKRLAVGLLSLLILVSAAAVCAAGGESLVTQSYLEDTYVPDVLEQAEGRVEERTQSAYQAALSELDSLHSAYLGEWSYAPAMTDLRFKEGDVIRLPAGSGAMLLAGSAQLSYSSGGGVDYNALADALSAMGLFQGTGTAYGSGYDLEQAPTRIVGLVMFLRLIGEEGAALRSTAANPFADTPAWCDRYVAYAYAQGYTQGVGAGADGRLYFDPDGALTAGEYLTFLLRALGYTDSGAAPDFTWSTALERAVDLGLLNSAERAMLEEESFLRAQVVYLSCFALSAPTKDGGILLDRTAEQGALSQTQLQSILDGVTDQRLS